MRRRLAAAVFSSAIVLACAVAPAHLLSAPSTVSQIPHDAAADLQHDIERLVADPTAGAGTWGVEVRSLTTHTSLAAVNPHRLLTPASTLKTLTLAVAADQLGWDYTFETRGYVDGTIANGTLTGDLVVVGSGDPSIDDWDGVATLMFRSWADRLRQLGITRINGSIVADASAFADLGLGTGWAWDDLPYSYSAPARALQFNEGAVQLFISPAASPGASATVDLSPRYGPVTLRSQVLTVPSGTPAAVGVEQQPQTDVFTLRGQVPVGAPRQVRTVAVASPPRYFAAALKTALIANGIPVSGDAVESDGPRVLTGSASSQPAAISHRSPRLASLADTMMKLSQNMYAETLLRTIGRERGEGGSGDAGRKVVRDVLSSWGIPASELLIADGSGLSRYNLVTADAMTSVLDHVYASDQLREPYIASLPVAGRAGTLAGRMRTTAAEGTVRAKTGSFGNARAVAGFARTADGEPLAFSIIANNYGVAPELIDRVTDGIIVQLATFHRR